MYWSIIVWFLGNNLPSETVLFDIAFNVVVTHVKFELKALLDIDDTGVWTAFSVDLAVEQFWSLNLSHHVAGSAVDGDIVAGRQFICGCFRDFQVRILKCKCSVNDKNFTKYEEI